MRVFTTLLLLLISHSINAQQPFKGKFYSKSNHITLVLDLYESSIEVPGYSFLGKMNGYMKGNSSGDLYGVWLIVTHKVQANKATLRFVNDIGADTQEVEFTINSDGTYSYKAIGKNFIKKAIGRRLESIPAQLKFELIGD
ncbi:hypothetical protein [Alloprevotella tannerae]|jgi:hypothetical protein|uniref:hypothetical protein n=1 Tax=Alloprevotella tannerae TaxID=76122 RepID=UPI001EDC906D|nr:hypothetical protein [Alloprevotella tannerae]MCG2650969.1 hypothetical protein [Alloprevotella tannerae]